MHRDAWPRNRGRLASSPVSTLSPVISMNTLIKITLLTFGLGAAAYPAFSAATTSTATTDAITTNATPEAKPAAHARAKALAKHRAEIGKHVAQKLGLSADQVSQLKAK